MTTILDLPIDVLGIILRKTFVTNWQAIKLEIVCKNFKEAMNKYQDRSKQEDFVCKGCYHKSYSIVKVNKCKNCPYDDFSHDGNCKTLKLRTGGYYTTEIKKCISCGQFCNKHKSSCEYGEIKVRGICGFCCSCLSYKLGMYECNECGLEFMSPFKGKEPYCLKCLPKVKPKFKINPEWREILLTDEPFCY